MISLAASAPRCCPAYVGYVSRANPNQPGADWQFEVNVVLTRAVLGMVVLDILEGDRLGGIEFVDRISRWAA
jgi:hypothetical protein